MGLRLGYVVFDPGEPLEYMREFMGERSRRLRVLGERLVLCLLYFNKCVLVVETADDEVRTVDFCEVLARHD